MILIAPPDALSQYPGADVDVVTGVPDGHPTLAAKLFLPGGIDLHNAEVIGAVGIAVDGVRLEAAFDLGDGLKEMGRDMISGACLLETEGVEVRRGKENQDAKKQGRSSHNASFSIR